MSWLARCKWCFSLEWDENAIILYRVQVAYAWAAYGGVNLEIYFFDKIDLAHAHSYEHIHFRLGKSSLPFLVKSGMKSIGIKVNSIRQRLCLDDYCWTFTLEGFLHLFPGNNRVMKLRWCGRCNFICTSSTHQIGITAAQCPPSSSFMVPFLLVFMLLSILALASRRIMGYCVSSAFPECTSITFTRKMLLLSGLQSYIWPPLS